jgi:hypothetical protein
MFYSCMCRQKAMTNMQEHYVKRLPPKRVGEFVRAGGGLSPPQPRHALQKARIVIDHDYDCPLRHHIRAQLLGRYMAPLGLGQPLIWINGI